VSTSVVSTEIVVRRLVLGSQVISVWTSNAHFAGGQGAMFVGRGHFAVDVYTFSETALMVSILMMYVTLQFRKKV
jgi:hypothetical protein